MSFKPKLRHYVKGNLAAETRHYFPDPAADTDTYTDTDIDIDTDTDTDTDN